MAKDQPLYTISALGHGFVAGFDGTNKASDIEWTQDYDAAWKLPLKEAEDRFRLWSKKKLLPASAGIVPVKERS